LIEGCTRYLYELGTVNYRGQRRTPNGGGKVLLKEEVLGWFHFLGDLKR